MYKDVYCSTVHNSKKVEPTQPSFSKGMDKSTVI